MRKAHSDLLQRLMPRESERAIESNVWRRMSPQQRIESLTGHSLDNCRDILDLPLEMAVQSPNVMVGKVQVIRAVLNVVTRVGLENAKHREMQDKVLDKLIEDIDADDLDDIEDL